MGLVKIKTNVNFDVKLFNFNVNIFALNFIFNNANFFEKNRLFYHLKSSKKIEKQQKAINKTITG